MMAKTKEITIAYGRKISDGDFGSGEFYFGETVTLEEGDNRNKEVRRLNKRVQNQGSEMFAEIKKAINPKPKISKKQNIVPLLRDLHGQ